MSKTVDALDKFAQVLNAMMDEMGMDGKSYTVKELRYIVAECFKEFKHCFMQLLDWIMYGDDRKARFMNLIRANAGEWRRSGVQVYSPELRPYDSIAMHPLFLMYQIK